MNVKELENSLDMISAISIFLGANDKELYQEVMSKNAWITRDQHLGRARECLKALTSSLLIQFERELDKREDALFQQQDAIYSCLCAIKQAYDRKCDAIRAGDKAEEQETQNLIDKLDDDFLRIIGW